MNKKRLRGPNFSNSDCLLLCDIVKKYKDILENKKTDGVTLVQKQKAWINVMEEFNANNTGYHRTVESLQQNYKNLKRKAKKSASDAKMVIPVNNEVLIQNIEEYGTTSEGWEKVANSTGESKENCQKLFGSLSKEANIKDKNLIKKIMGTGGGPPPNNENDPLLEKVKRLVGPTIDGLYTIYDGDSCLMETQNTIPIEYNNRIHETLNKTSKVDTDEEPLQESKDETITYFTSDRSNLKKKRNDLLTRKKKLSSEMPEKQTVAEKFKVLASEKIELITLQKEILKKQVLEQEEQINHNRLLRAMELTELKKKYDHNDQLRQIELKNIINK